MQNHTKTQIRVLARNSLLLAGSLLGLITPMPALAQYSPPSSGLVAWWRGEGNANDSADSHNGVLQNGMGFTTGLFGQAFLGGPSAERRVYVPDSTAFQLTSSLSIGAWVNISANSYTVLLRGDSRPGLDPYGLSLDGLNHMLFEVTDSNNVTASVSATIPFNTWEQVTATLDGSNGDMRLYFNGSLVAETFTTVRPMGPLNAGGGIGIANTPIYDYPLLGAIDEVVLYDRALSPSEVLSLVPEPGSAAMYTLGAGLFLVIRRRRQDLARMRCA